MDPLTMHTATVDRVIEVYNAIQDAMMALNCTKTEAICATLTVVAIQIKGDLPEQQDMIKFIADMTDYATAYLMPRVSLN